MGAWYDEAVVSAAGAAAMIDLDSHPGRRERALVEAFRDGLALDGRFKRFALEERCGLKTFTSPPGGIDLVAYFGPSERLDFEMKVEKPDEVIWDAIKLAELQAGGRCHGIAGAYLVLWATEGTWMTGEASPLFAEARNWGVQEMIETWPKAWNRLRVGGRGKVPESSVVEIGFEPIGGPTQVGGGGSHDASVRVARVWPARLERLEFEGEGWPSAMDVPKFATPMVDIRRSRSGPPRGDSDPCHGYTWPARWTQRSLEEVVAVLDADARSCLRARLGAERSWSESELRERFDPLPGL